MQFDPPLQPVILFRRYKRFPTNVVTPDGCELTLHCPSTGVMAGCTAPDDIVWYSTFNNMKRKYTHIWELAEAQRGAVIYVNTLCASSLVKEAISIGIIPELSGYNQLKNEAKYGKENSHINTMLQTDDRQSYYIEMRSATLAEKEHGYFSDVVTTHGQKYLRELIVVVANNGRAVILFAISYSVIDRFSPTHHIDARYVQLLTEVRDRGVEILAWKAELSTTKMTLNKSIAVVLNPGK